MQIGRRCMLLIVRIDGKLTYSNFIFGSYVKGAIHMPQHDIYYNSKCDGYYFHLLKRQALNKHS